MDGCQLITDTSPSTHVHQKQIIDYSVSLTVKDSSPVPEQHAAALTALLSAVLMIHHLQQEEASVVHSDSHPGATCTQTHRSKRSTVSWKLEQGLDEVPFFLVPVMPSHHLLVVEVQVEVAIEGHWTSPHHSPQKKDDGAVIEQEVEQILISMEGTQQPI